MLENKAKELVKEIEDVKKTISDYMMSNLSFEEIIETDPAGLMMLKKSYDLLNKSTEFLVEEAYAIDQLNKKLDKVLDLLETKS